MSQIKITQTKSLISRKGDHAKTMRALGLRRINHSVVHEDTPQIMGMVSQVRYLIDVEEVKSSKSKKK